MSDEPSDTSTAPGVTERAPQQVQPQQHLPQQQSGSLPAGGPVHLDRRFARVQSLLAPQSGMRAAPAVPDDDYVVRMQQFLRRYAPSPPAARLRLGTLFPGPYGALQLREHGARELQLSVQCRILAMQSDLWIARKTGLSPLTIDWYEKCFFNVRENLHAPDWIAAHVLHSSCLQNLSPQEGPWKRAAYLFGPRLFDALWSGLPQSADGAAGGSAESELSVDSADISEDIMESAVQAGVRRRALLAALNDGQAIPKEFIVLVRQMQAWATAKLDSESSSDTQVMLAEAVRHTLDNIHFIKGDMAVEWLQEHNPILLEYDNFAAELRDQQVYQAVSGNVASLEHLRYRTLPPPPTRDDPPVSNKSNKFDPE